MMSSGQRKTRRRALEPPSSHPSTCSPDAYEENYQTDGTCLSYEDMVAIAKHWNNIHPERPISMSKLSATSTKSSKSVKSVKSSKSSKSSKSVKSTTKDPTTTKKIALDALMHRLGSLGPQLLETDLVSGNPALYRRLKARFRPKHPASWAQNPVAWLSTSDIEVVMQQYQRLHPDFAFLGVHPRDFASLDHTHGADIRNVPLEQYIKKGIHHAGAVLNLDRNDQAGSHWVACFLSIDPARPLYGAYYYDSVARPPPHEIAAWMVNLRDRVQALDKRERKFELTYNKERRQFQNTECGMFAMFFLAVAMRNSCTFERICKDMGTDKDMAAMRHVMFRS